MSIVSILMQGRNQKERPGGLITHLLRGNNMFVREYTTYLTIPGSMVQDLPVVYFHEAPYTCCQCFTCNLLVVTRDVTCEMLVNDGLQTES